MRNYDFEFLIDGQPILVPDEDISISYEDLDSEESGRDESYVMHRIVGREGVKKIPLSYAFLNRDEYRYMESLFKGKPSFRVECRDESGEPLSFIAYRAKHSITVNNVKTGLHKNYNFNLVEC